MDLSRLTDKERAALREAANCLYLHDNPNSALLRIVHLLSDDEIQECDAHLFELLQKEYPGVELDRLRRELKDREAEAAERRESCKQTREAGHRFMVAHDAAVQDNVYLLGVIRRLVSFISSCRYAGPDGIPTLRKDAEALYSDLHNRGFGDGPWWNPGPHPGGHLVTELRRLPEKLLGAEAEIRCKDGIVERWEHTLRPQP